MHSTLLCVHIVSEAKRHDFLASLDGQARECFRRTRADLEFHPRKSRVGQHRFLVFPRRLGRSRHGAVDSLHRDDDTPLQFQRCAQSSKFIPQSNRIFHADIFIEKQNGQRHGQLIKASARLEQAREMENRLGPKAGFIYLDEGNARDWDEYHHAPLCGRGHCCRSPAR